MRSPLDIQQLAADVLASVDADEASRAKTASDATPAGALKTDVGRALKLAAEQIRAHDDSSVTSTDLEVVLTGARVKIAGLMGAAAGGLAGSPLGPLGMLGGAALGHMATGGGGAGAATGAAPIGPQQGSTGLGNVAPSAAMPKMASPLGDELRKIAADLRKNGSASDEIRTTKAAQMLNAAVGLEHLVHSIKTR